MGALVAGVAAGFGDRVDVRGHIRPFKKSPGGVFWEFGAGTEERDVDTVATIIWPMIRSDSRVKRRFINWLAMTPPSLFTSAPASSNAEIQAVRRSLSFSGMLLTSQ